MTLFHDDVQVEQFIRAAVYPAPEIVAAIWDLARTGNDTEKKWAFEALENVVYDMEGLFINE